MTLRLLTPDDADTWKEVRLRMLKADQENFLTRYEDWVTRPMEDWRLGLETSSYVAAFDDGRVVGAMGLAPGSGAARHRATLIAVWLAPEWRGSGKADAMLRQLTDVAKDRGFSQIELHVLAENTRAIGFYERNGFQRIGFIPRALMHHGSYFDELIMVLMLDA
jgi:ribosomal protein S18 acetylase RimI-like enzyme